MTEPIKLDRHDREFLKRVEETPEGEETGLELIIDFLANDWNDLPDGEPPDEEPA